MLQINIFIFEDLEAFLYFKMKGVVRFGIKISELDCVFEHVLSINVNHQVLIFPIPIV